jgi:hypothetical protein
MLIYFSTSQNKEYDMKQLIFGVFLAVLSSTVSAQCYGTGAFKNCYDSKSGNSYTIQKFGNQTQMNGYNAGTGSSWSQNSTTIGNTTFNNGRAANGNSWNSTETRIGNRAFGSGTDSNGKSFNYTR